MSLVQHTQPHTATDTHRSSERHHRAQMIAELTQDLWTAVRRHKPSIFLGTHKFRRFPFVILPCQEEVKAAYAGCSSTISELEIGPHDQIDIDEIRGMLKEVTEKYNADPSHKRKIYVSDLTESTTTVMVNGTPETFKRFTFVFNIDGDA